MLRARYNGPGGAFEINTFLPYLEETVQRKATRMIESVDKREDGLEGTNKRHTRGYLHTNSAWQRTPSVALKLRQKRPSWFEKSGGGRGVFAFSEFRIELV